MAILLIHFRRILLIIAVIYMSGSLLSKIIQIAKCTNSSIRFNSKRRITGQLQTWVYLYTVYSYVLILNSFRWNKSWICLKKKEKKERSCNNNINELSQKKNENLYANEIDVQHNTHNFFGVFDVILILRIYVIFALISSREPIIQNIVLNVYEFV